MVQNPEDARGDTASLTYSCPRIQPLSQPPSVQGASTDRSKALLHLQTHTHGDLPYTPLPLAFTQ